MSREHNRCAGVEANIGLLMEHAVAEPYPNDPMGMVGIAATYAAAMMFLKEEESKLLYSEATTSLVQTLQAHIQYSLPTRLTRTSGCCYGRDIWGQPWATFTTFNYRVTCAICGTSINGGWSCGRLGDERYVCLEHARLDLLPLDGIERTSE